MSFTTLTVYVSFYKTHSAEIPREESIKDFQGFTFVPKLNFNVFVEHYRKLLITELTNGMIFNESNSFLTLY